MALKHQAINDNFNRYSQVGEGLVLYLWYARSLIGVFKITRFVFKNNQELHLQHEIKKLQSVAMSLQGFCNEEIQNTQWLRLYVHTISVLEGKPFTETRNQ